jgi:hypothetical protein
VPLEMSSIQCPGGVLPSSSLYLFGICSTWGGNVNAYKGSESRK